ncbi:MAG: hypothetical protein FWC32_03785 [Firmicutes bacterium]|nr:hypothetical protein [Bacillota bacterium]
MRKLTVEIVEKFVEVWYCLNIGTHYAKPVQSLTNTLKGGALVKISSKSNTNDSYMKKVLNYLQSPGFLISIILTVVTIVVSIIITHRFRATNQITISYNNSTQILTNKPGSGITFVYNDIEIDNAFLTILNLRNTGNFVVTEEDFREPMYIVFDSDIRIYDALVMDNTTGLINGIGVRDNSIEIKEFFLNPGEFINIQILSSSEVTSHEILHRISGLESIRTPFRVPSWFASPYFFVVTLTLNVVLLLLLFILRLQVKLLEKEKAEKEMLRLLSKI